MDAVKQVMLLGLTFNDIALAPVVELLLARPAGEKFAYVVTPNSDHLARLRRAPELAGAYREAWLCLLDSQVLARLADRLRLPRPAVVTGADLVAALLPRLAGLTAAVIGMAPADFAALQRRFPQINFAHHQPPMGLLHNAQAFAQARDFAAASGARFTFIVLGSPLQERLAQAIARTGATGTGLCIGAALEFAAGRPRAPGWMRRAGLEWLHRLARDPRRLARRYLLDDPPVLLALLREARRRRA
jgi:N-acetylglucosaminyldiphosphoundecaprenol N-acetyl-beta-D-mannosaminyltransferase